MNKRALHGVSLALILFLSGCATGGAKKITYIEVNSRDCYVCQRMDTVLDEVEKQFGDAVDVRTYSGSSEGAADMVKKYNIRKFPANIFLDDKGAVFYRHEGLLDIQSIKGIFRMKDITGPEGVTQAPAQTSTPGAGAK